MARVINGATKSTYSLLLSSLVLFSLRYFVACFVLFLLLIMLQDPVIHQLLLEKVVREIFAGEDILIILSLLAPLCSFSHTYIIVACPQPIRTPPFIQSSHSPL